MQLLQNVYYGNTVQAWLMALGLAVVTYVVLRVVARVALTRLVQLAGHTRIEWDDIVTDALQKTKGFVLLILGVYVGAGTLDLPADVQGGLENLAIIALLVQAGIYVTTGIKRWSAKMREEKAVEDAATVMTMNVIGIAARIATWSMVLLLALQNLGIDVTALIAGLGVGGIAVALAAQNILGDLFASLSIALDRPFLLGDFLIVGDFLGSVEEIGLKTTRVRSLSGEQVVFSNADLLNSRIKNYGRMYERRVLFKIGVTYQTPREQLKAIPEMIREAVETRGERVRFDRAHFQAYGDFALVFETVYYVLSPEYNVHMDIQQAIFLDVHERFESQGIEFAYPTQTLFLVKEGGEGE